MNEKFAGLNTKDEDITLSSVHKRKFSAMEGLQQVERATKMREEISFLTILDRISAALNVGDTKLLYKEFEKVCDPRITVQIARLDFPLVGINALFIFCVILLQCYPDYLFNILERRIVNLMIPLSHRNEKTIDDFRQLGIERFKIEFICKFFGTHCSYNNPAIIFKSFLTSILSLRSMGEENDVVTKSEKDLISIYCAEIAQMNDEDLCSNLISFTKGIILPNSQVVKQPITPPVRQYIFELLLSINPENQKVIQGEMRYLATTESFTEEK